VDLQKKNYSSRDTVPLKCLVVQDKHLAEIAALRMELKQDRASAAAALALARYVGPSYSTSNPPLSPLLGGIRQGGAKTKIGIGESKEKAAPTGNKFQYPED
jgi:hypothetical protein